jgi:hypothetical protein
MPRIRIPRPFAAVALLAGVACSVNPVDLCSCTLPTPYTIVYGLVTDPAGAPVAGAGVQVEVGGPGCQAMERGPETPTDAAARYRTGVTPTGSAAGMCVRLSARPPAGSPLRGSDTVQLTLPTPTTLPADSVRRDLVLRAP